MNKSHSILMLVLSILGATSVEAQSTARVPIQINHSGEDSVGKRVAYELKEQLAQSSRYKLADDATAFTTAVISVVSLNIKDRDYSNDRSALSIEFSVSWNCGRAGAFPTEMTHSVAVVGADAPTGESKTIVANFTSWLEERQQTACGSFGKDGYTTSKGMVVYVERHR